ncbi:MAG: prepilin peptidase [Lachnospiraceae bacterium]|nr:prepilin peptidase [Lachnospiraceae bacterium]
MDIVDIFSITLAFFAMVSDLRTYKIPNRICLTGVLSGLVLNFVLHGCNGLKMSLTGIVYPVLMLYLFFLIRVIGAGDIKLLAGIGAFVSKRIIYIIFVAFVLASFYSIICITCKVVRRFLSKSKKRYTFSRMHLSVPIFISCAVCFVCRLTGA